jgi:hypothetical protein
MHAARDPAERRLHRWLSAADDRVPTAMIGSLPAAERESGDHTEVPRVRSRRSEHRTTTRDGGWCPAIGEQTTHFDCVEVRFKARLGFAGWLSVQRPLASGHADKRANVRTRRVKHVVNDGCCSLGPRTVRTPHRRVEIM